MHRHRTRLARAGNRERRRNGHTRLEGAAPPRVNPRIQQHHVVRAVRLLKLAHDQAPVTGRRRPVHRATVIARLVVSQGMEGHVRARQLLAGHALDVHLHARRIKGKTHRRRMHMHEDRFIPLAHATQQSQTVHTHRARRTHVDHATALRHHREGLVPRPVPANRGDHELATASSDRDLHEGRTRAASRLVNDAHAAHRHLTGNDAIVLHAQRHRQRRRGRHRRDRHHEGHQAHDGHHEALDPAKGDRGHRARDEGDEHRPAHRRQCAQPTRQPHEGGNRLQAGARIAPRRLDDSTKFLHVLTTPDDIRAGTGRVA